MYLLVNWSTGQLVNDITSINFITSINSINPINYFFSTTVLLNSSKFNPFALKFFTVG
jgi:hypothetical protein